MGIGGRMKEIRKEKGLTQADVSRNLMVSQSYISSVECGNEMPNARFVKLFCLQYGVDEAELLCKGKIVPMEKELEFLEELLLRYGEQKDMDNKQSEDATEKYNMLIRIAKLVRAEALNMELRKKAGHYDVPTIAQRLLNESATAYVRSVNADSAEVEVIDEVHRNIIAKFKVKIALHCLMFIDAQFF